MEGEYEGSYVVGKESRMMITDQLIVILLLILIELHTFWQVPSIGKIPSDRCECLLR